MAAETSQRVLEQVNWNLDSYLRSMMRVSDTVYYRVIKNADLEQSGTEQELRDALELLYARIGTFWCLWRCLTATAA